MISYLKQNMKNKKIYITKASGEKELFNEMKIYKTVIKAGASQQLAEEVKNEIQKKIKPNINSDVILNDVLEYLNKREKTVAIKYSLKKGIMDLGPSGYSFEKYIAMILKEYGYTIKLNQFIKGHCLTYEIDILAKKENKIFITECKYYNRPGLRSDTNIALYTHARFLDIKKHWIEKLNKSFSYNGLLVTNTKCTTNAIKYIECVGEMNVIGWHYPKTQNLESLIEQKKLYPITCFPFLKNQIKNNLIANNIILIKDLLALDFKTLSQKFEGITLKEFQTLQDAAHNIYTHI